MSLKCNRALYFLIGCTALTSCRVLAYYPPRIFPPDQEIVINSGGNLTLRCEGQEKIKWTIPVANNGEQTSYAVIETHDSMTPDEEYPFGSLLTIANASYVDTGFYHCHHLDTVDFNDLSRTAAVYVYVKDDEELAVPLDSFLTVSQGSTVILGCKPTSPDVKVSLEKDGEKIENLWYDPKIGFELVDVQVYDSNHYICTFSLNEVESELLVNLMVHPSTHSIAEPLIEMAHEIVGAGEETEMTCQVSVNPDVFFNITWIVPNEDGLKTGRIIISKTTRVGKDLGKSVLKIRRTMLDDEGEYFCNVRDNNNNSNQNSKYLKVLEKNISHITLTEANNISTLKVQSGEPTVTWIIRYNAYPQVKLIWMDNKNQMIVSGWSDSVRDKYEVTTTKSTTMLKINNLSLADTGIYQLKAINELQEKVLNLTLIVTEKPTVQIESEEFHLVGRNATVQCIVAGYPVPNVHWQQKMCYQDNACDIVDIPSDQYDNVIQGLKLTSTLNILASNSGYITCLANNTLGTDENTVGFHVTDIMNGFDILFPEEIILGDDVELTCAASVYNFSDLIHWFRSPDFQPILPNEKFSIQNITTDFSYQVLLKIKNISREDEMEYICRANELTTVHKNGLQERKIFLNIKDPESPVIEQTNMKDDELKISIGRPVDLFCYSYGLPPPTVKWYKGSEVIKPDPDHIALEDSNAKLVFKYVDQDDEGEYTCLAENRVGFDKQSLSLIVMNKPYYELWIGVICLCILIIIILAIFVTVKNRKNRKLAEMMQEAGLANFEQGALDSLNPELGVDDQAELLPYDKRWEFPRDKLKLGKQLGSGAFGVVMKAQAVGIIEEGFATTVAVKMVKRNADSTYIKALASELKIMVHLGKHLNVVNLLGACTKNVVKKELLVIVEYCHYGNLHNYLLKHRSSFIDQIDTYGKIDPSIRNNPHVRSVSTSSSVRPYRWHSGLSENYPPSSKCVSDATETSLLSSTSAGEDNFVFSTTGDQPEWRSNYKGDYKEIVRPITTQDLLCWSFQVARGMEYLASRKVLHGDLAARNILLADNNVVKICDFGLAKSMYKSDNYKKSGDGPLPVKWMAIESIRDVVFSTQSDVWSFGIVLWELFSLGRTPYPGMDPNEQFYKKLIEGYRMEKPGFSTADIYNVMLDCWNAVPERRPSFTMLTMKLGEMLEEGVKQHYIELNDPYVCMNRDSQKDTGTDYLMMMSSPEYGNFATASAHDYVNTGEDLLLDSSGYLRMSAVEKPGEIFTPGKELDGESSRKKRRSREALSGVELQPMLRAPSPASSDGENGHGYDAAAKPPSQSSSSVANPSYFVGTKPEAAPRRQAGIIQTPDNYVNVPHYRNVFNSDAEKLNYFVNPPNARNKTFV